MSPVISAAFGKAQVQTEGNFGNAMFKLRVRKSWGNEILWPVLDHPESVLRTMRL